MPAWSSGPTEGTRCVAWADVDGDGDLDLACANDDGGNTVYENLAGTLSATPIWASEPANDTAGLAWGDVDGDGDPDLACGNNGYNLLYINEGGRLSTTPAWSSEPRNDTISVAWGDVDGDGDLDLACGNWGQSDTVYENDGGALSTTPMWMTDYSPRNSTFDVAWGDADSDGDLDLVTSSSSIDFYENDAGILSTTPAWSLGPTALARSIAWGDVDGDGDLDLAAGRLGSNALYENQGGLLSATPVWYSEDTLSTWGVDWGDVDGDGDLDLVCANEDGSNTLYANAAGMLATAPSWSSGPASATFDVAWGDVDSDGDLDLACGNRGESNRLYENRGITLSTAPLWSSESPSSAFSLALGDPDGDGDLDLASGTSEGDALYENIGGLLSTTPVWRSDPTSPAFGLAWGDVDGDGDLDLATANAQNNLLYLNDGGKLSTSPSWVSTPINYSRSLAWADFDDDGDLDLAFGNAQRNTLYENDEGRLSETPVWSTESATNTTTILWGDVDGDGDLDLVCGNRGPNRVYENVGGSLSTAPVWSSQPANPTESMALGDVDGDGDPDLACGNDDTNNTIYENVGGSLSTTPVWSSDPTNKSWSIAWGDVDGDGDLDLACGNIGFSNAVYENQGGMLAAAPVWWSDAMASTHCVAWGDIDDDGDLDLVCANFDAAHTLYAGLLNPAFRGSALTPTNHLPNNAAHLRFVDALPVEKNVLRVSFRAIDVESDDLLIAPTFQFEGDPTWTPLDLTGGSLAVGPYSSSPDGVTGSFDWNVERFPADERAVVLRLLVSEIPGRVSVIQHVAPYHESMGPIVPLRPLISTDATELRFATVTLGDTAQVSVRLENHGNEALVVSGIDPPSPEMTWIPDAPFVVQPDAPVDMAVALSPRAALDADGELVIRSNDPVNPALRLLVDAEILPLSFTTDLLRAGPVIPLGDAATVITTPSVRVVLERGMLFFREAGSEADFDSLAMTRSGGNFAATIPGQSVTELGLEYYTRMENSGVFAMDPPGAPLDSLFFQAIEQPHLLEVEARPNSGARFLENRDILLLANVEAGVDIMSARVYYRAGGTTAFESVALMGEPPILSAVVPGEVASGRGIEYWTQVETATTTLRDPPEHPSTDPRTIQITVSNLRERHVHAGGRYRLLSIPLLFGEGFTGTIGDLLEFGARDPTEWRVFRYGGVNIELTEEGGIGFRPEPGRGFWLISRASHQVDTAPVAGLSTPTDGPHPIVISSGWNQFGNPFSFPVAWDSVQGPDTIEPPVAFDSSRGRTGGYSPDDVVALIPFEAYFIHGSSAEAETLWVPPVEAPDSVVSRLTPIGTFPRPMAAKHDASMSGWMLNLVARTDEAEDRTPVVGVRVDASDAYDRLDRLEPPSAPGAWVRLAIDHSDWSRRPGRYRHDFRKPMADGHRWDLVLRSREPGEEVTLSGWTEAVFPGELALRLVDLEQGVTLDLRERTEACHILSSGPHRDYRLALLAGTEEYVSQATEALIEVPGVVVLDQNAPNPFNPATRIRFGLPNASEVRLTIYNLRGERVASLIDGALLRAGYHTRIWDGRDHRGAEAASGVYIYRLVTEDETVGRKMVLMR